MTSSAMRLKPSASVAELVLALDLHALGEIALAHHVHDLREPRERPADRADEVSAAGQGDDERGRDAGDQGDPDRVDVRMDRGHVLGALGPLAVGSRPHGGRDGPEGRLQAVVDEPGPRLDGSWFSDPWPARPAARPGSPAWR